MAPAKIKEAICKGTLWGIRREAHKPGSTFWFKGGPRAIGVRFRGDHESMTTQGPIAGSAGQNPIAGSAGGDHAERFTHLRPLLFTIAYEILGSATESDDVLQDSYLRWADVDLATVRDAKSYLAQLVTRQALDTLREGVRRREDCIGPWLPEPLLLDDRDASADVVLAESVSMAMLVLLGTSPPMNARCSCCARRSASTTTKSPKRWANPRPHGASDGAPRPRRRARPPQPVQSRRHRADDTNHRAVPHRGVHRRHGRADGIVGAGGDLDRRPRRQGDRDSPAGFRRRRVAALMAELFRVAKTMPDLRFESAVYNSAPATVIYDGDHLEGVLVFEVIDEKITNLYAMRNPGATDRGGRRRGKSVLDRDVDHICAQAVTLPAPAVSRGRTSSTEERG